MADEVANDVELPEYSHDWWVKEIEAAEKRMDEEWRDAGDMIVDRYLDQRGDKSTTGDVSDTEEKRYNVFWANTEITKAALYATPPKPEVKREHADQKDDVGRVSALILQRILSLDINAEDSKTHDALKMVVEDFLLPGFGNVWVRLETETEEYPIPAQMDPFTGVEIAPASMGERIVHQEAPVDYVAWRDFIYPPIRTWGERPWLGRRVWMNKRKFIKRFSEAKYNEVKSSANSKHEMNGKMPKGFTKGKIEVFEIWCEESNKVYWVCRAADELLDEKDDPLQLDGFYPCPKPLISTHTTNSFKPRADYTMVQDQYSQLDTLNQRIDILTQALRVVGAYDKTNAELGTMLKGNEFNMIPVDNWAAFMENGGVKGNIEWFPVDVIAEVLSKLMDQRMAVVTQIYELTSISDIMRGASNPRDTLGAQRLKAQYSSVRLQLKQQSVSEFVRSALRIRGEIICKHFDPQQIYMQSQIEFTESAQMAQPAIQLLKHWGMAKYRISIGEETLSLADYNAERQLRTEYLTAVGQFLSQAGTILEAAPQAAPYMLKMIAWVTAAFRGASDIETVLDQAIQAASGAGAGGKPGEDPMDQAKADAMSNQSRAQADTVSAQAKASANIATTKAKTEAKAKEAIIDIAKANAMPKEPSAGE